MASDLRIVDPHVHLWDLSRARYGWLQDDPLPDNPAGDMSGIAHRNYGLKDYLADAEPWRIDKIVHVEAGLPVGQQLGETEWLQAMADDYGYPQGIVLKPAVTGARQVPQVDMRIDDAKVRRHQHAQ